MKNFLLLFMALAFFASCSAPLHSRMEDYIDKVEADCYDWTEKDWELSQERYDRLLKEYEQNYDSYTQEERDAINRAIGRYYGLLLRKGVENADTMLERFASRLPALLDGFMSAFDDAEGSAK